MSTPAPAAPDRPGGDAGHLLLLERATGTYWQVHADGARTLVGGTRDAERLVRGWMAWTEGHEVPGVGWVPGEFAGERYTLRVIERRDLGRWPDASPTRAWGKAS